MRARGSLYGAYPLFLPKSCHSSLCLGYPYLEVRRAEVGDQMHLQLSFELNHLTYLIVPKISLSWSSYKMAQNGCFTQDLRLLSSATQSFVISPWTFIHYL